VAALSYVSRGRVIGANDRIGVGLIGAGGRGGGHVATVQLLIKAGENLQIAAVNDAFRYRLDEAAKPTGAKAYMKHAELLANPEVDVACISTPDRLHWKNFIKCVRSREKPVSDVDFAVKVQAAMCMSMKGFLKDKVARFDRKNLKILL
jgi:predicted dehydrogenase